MERRIYLASPYTSPDKNQRICRYGEVCLMTAQLLREGHLVFSPIAHSHPLAGYGLPVEFEFWQRHCLSFLETWATDLWVLTLSGWQESLGVTAEIRFAREHGLPVSLVNLIGRMEPYRV